MAFVAWAKRVDPTAVYRPPAERPADKSAWSWLEKWERRERILKDDHDAAITDPDPEDPPPPPPPDPTWPIAPRTYNAVLPHLEPSARFCTTGLPRNANGRLFDQYSEYDDNGLALGGRTEATQVPGLKPANEMDGRGPCDPYGSFPPWPTDSYIR